MHHLPNRKRENKNVVQTKKRHSHVNKETEKWSVLPRFNFWPKNVCFFFFNDSTIREKISGIQSLYR